MVFAKLPNSIFSELGVEIPEGDGPEVIDLENATFLSNKSARYSVYGQVELTEGSWETVTICEHP